MVSPRDTQELVEAVRRVVDRRAMHGPEADAALTELAERLETAERQLSGDDGWTTARDWKRRTEDAERELASTTAAALLLHKRVEELERVKEEAWTSYKRAVDAVAERDKRIERLRGALREIGDRPLIYGEVVAEFCSSALADPVVVPGWDDGTWNQEC